MCNYHFPLIRTALNLVFINRKLHSTFWHPHTTDKLIYYLIQSLPSHANNQQPTETYPLTLPNTNLLHTLSVCHGKSYLSIFFTIKENPQAGPPNSFTINFTLVYWSLHDMIGCDVVVAWHWHSSSLH